MIVHLLQSSIQVRCNQPLAPYDLISQLLVRFTSSASYFSWFSPFHAIACCDLFMIGSVYLGVGLSFTYENSEGSGGLGGFGPDCCIWDLAAPLGSATSMLLSPVLGWFGVFGTVIPEFAARFPRVKTRPFEM